MTEHQEALDSHVASKRSRPGQLGLASAALLLLLATAIGAMGTWLQARSEASKYDRLNCLSIVYDFEGNVNTDITEADRKRAEIYGCDLNKLLETSQE